MDFRALALRVLNAADIDVKLAPAPAVLTDDEPGPPLPEARPARSESLRIVSARAARVPALAGMRDPAQRPRILHAFANHELQAVELCAWALVAFPGAPAEWRGGMVSILADEQRHCRMYMARLAAFAVRFGDFPVSGYFWGKVAGFQCPLDFVCAMNLTFENANLDHTVAYAAAARTAGDLATAALFDTVHRDEIEHVRFGWKWLGRLKQPSESSWDAYTHGLAWPLRPDRARGARFQAAGRRAAGIDEDFIARLSAADCRRDAPPPAGRDHPR